MGLSYDRELIARKLRRGAGDKDVYVRDRELCVLGADTDIARRWDLKTDWSLAGVFRWNAEVDDVLEAIDFVRDEQRQLRRAMRNYDVRAY